MSLRVLWITKRKPCQTHCHWKCNFLSSLIRLETYERDRTDELQSSKDNKEKAWLFKTLLLYGRICTWIAPRVESNNSFLGQKSIFELYTSKLQQNITLDYVLGAPHLAIASLHYLITNNPHHYEHQSIM